MDYGFIIDNRRCIGCHACTVACKAEHRIPLGCFRTWVKYVEKGVFPHVKRQFTVLRCNHCDDAPCVNICPTGALFHRDDGIVDFERTRCIACKSCMAACPYDAIYIDPETDTAAKCNYCAHRMEAGLEPACVTACPVSAIVAGDLDSPASAISRLLALNRTSVRKPEQGTAPKVHYINGDTASLMPDAAPKTSSYIWAQRHEGPQGRREMNDPGSARTVYDVAHGKPWGRAVSAYLWAKSLATGPILVASLLSLMGLVRAPELFGRSAPLIAVLMGFVTTLCLVGDLERPERFLKVLYRPNPRSWLTWGAYLLVVYSGIAFFWGAAGYTNQAEVIRSLLWPGLLFAALAAGYSAFLLVQARGRDLWHSRLLFPHLIVQSVLAGSGVLVLAALYNDSGPGLTDLLLRWLVGALCLHGIFVLSEIGLPHGSLHAGASVGHMVQGPLARMFWLGAVLAGIAVPIYQLAYHFSGRSAGSFTPVSAVILALVGLLVYQNCYIRAGQAVPLS